MKAKKKHPDNTQNALTVLFIHHLVRPGCFSPQEDELHRLCLMKPHLKHCWRVFFTKWNIGISITVTVLISSTSCSFQSINIQCMDNTCTHVCVWANEMCQSITSPLKVSLPYILNLSCFTKQWCQSNGGFREGIMYISSDYSSMETHTFPVWGWVSNLYGDHYGAVAPAALHLTWIRAFTSDMTLRFTFRWQHLRTVYNIWLLDDWLKAGCLKCFRISLVRKRKRRNIKHDVPWENTEHELNDATVMKGQDKNSGMGEGAEIEAVKNDIP